MRSPLAKRGVLGAAIVIVAGAVSLAHAAALLPEPLRDASFLEADVLERIARLPDDGFPFEAAILRVSAAAEPYLTGRIAETGRAGAALDGIAERVRTAIAPSAGPDETVEALRRVLFLEERLAYDAVAGDPENYLPDRVLERKRGNCLGLSVVLLAVGERLGLPLYGVYVPGHCFVRYEDGRTRINIESAIGGASRRDMDYARDFRLSSARPYLRSLSRRTMMGVFLKSLGAAFARKGMDARAISLYRGAAAFAPGLPDIPFNAGVSLQRMGRLDEAIARYRRALELDPDMAAARDNLGVALAAAGDYAEALVEASRAVELDPCNPVSRGNLAAVYCARGNAEDGVREYLRGLMYAPKDPRLRAGLARAYFAAGNLHEAAAACDLAESVGCRIDPEMKATLAPYRGSPGPSRRNAP